MSAALQSNPHLASKPAILRWLSPFRVAVAATLLTLIPGYFWGRHLEQEQRYAAWLQQKRIAAALQKPVIRFDPQQKYVVGNLLRELSRQVGVRIELDPDDVRRGILNANHEISLENPYTFTTQPETLEAILWRVAGGLSANNETNPFNTFPHVVMTRDRGRITLTSRSLPGEALITQVYPVSTGMPGGVVISSEDLSDLIQLTVVADSWEDVGGPGSIVGLPTAMIVTNTQAVNEQARQAAERLTTLPAVPESLSPVPLFPIDSLAENRIVEMLDSPATFDYCQTPLSEVFDDITRRFSIPIILATKKLEEAGIDIKQPITFRIRNVSLGSCLKHLLRDLGLTYLIKSEVMQITTPEDACSQMSEVLYPIHDLVEDHNEESMDGVLDLLTSVEQHSWDKVGGPGSIFVISRGWVLVWQSPDVHQNLNERLKLLRAQVRSSLWPPVKLTPSQLAHERIVTRLEQDYHGDSAGLTFAEYFEKVQEDIGIPVLAGPRALDESRISANYRPAIDSIIQPLWRQLEAALEPSGLGLDIQDEAIVITFRDSGRWYPEVLAVQDLTSDGKELLSGSELRELMASAIEPDQWTVSTLRGHFVVENRLRNILEARSLIRYLKKSRHNLPRVADVRRMPEDSVSYQSFLDETEHDHDRWRKAYLEFALQQPFVDSPH